MLTQAAFASLAGVSRAAVGKAVAAGRLIRQASGLIDENDALSKHYLANRAAANTNEPHEAPPPGIRPEHDPRALSIAVKIGERWYPAVRHVFDDDGGERSMSVHPLPAAVTILWDGPGAAAAVDSQGRELELFIDGGPEAEAAHAQGRGGGA